MAAIQFDNIDATCTIESFTATVRVTFQVRKGTKFSATLSRTDAWKLADALPAALNGPLSDEGPSDG